jgi:hypothetical protein
LTAGPQPYLCGGGHEPLTRADIEDKLMLNARHGGWREVRITAAPEQAKTLYDGRLDLSAWRE